MNDRWKNIWIGIFVSAAFGIGIALILFLKPTIGDGKQILKVRFANITAINKGTRVTYAGRPIGQVIKIEEIPNAREGSIDNIGRVYFYELFLQIDSRIDVYPCDEISICTQGLMGERSIAIVPKASPLGHPLAKLGKDQIIFANSIDPLENAFTQISHVANKAEKTIDNFNGWFDQNAQTLSQMSSNVSDVAHSLNGVLTSIDQQNLVSSFKETLDLASSNLKELYSAFNDDQLLTRLASLIKDLNDAVVVFTSDGSKTLSNLNQITQEIATGSGTIGHLLHGDDFYLRLNAILNKSETLMNDINHYGLLFQYNKQWQKNRTKKATLVNALNSPKEFRSFFEYEIDEISASLGRISELLDRADQDKEREQIFQNMGFQKDFAVLLRQVKALNDAVRLFNEDLPK